MAHVLVSGGTGFIGKAVVQTLAAAGYRVTILSRFAGRHEESAVIRTVKWPDDVESFAATVGPIDVLINLAGDPINKGRWSAAKKRSILTSRVESTRNLLAIAKALPEPPNVLINASAIGYYGFDEQRTFTEHDIVHPHGFLTEVSDVWEEEALRAQSLGMRVVLARFGIVLGRGGGALAPMALPYKWFGGGTVGSGKQWVSWIHLADVCGLMMHLIAADTVTGAVNFTAPEPLTMNLFGRTLGTVLHRPHWLPVPEFGLRLLFGEMADLLVKGQRVLPQKALDSGYRFRFPTAQAALQDLLT
jgi:uncharacterized protein (TIGR01777 family)